jgi:hypothetical protein
MGHAPDEGVVLASAGSGLARTDEQRALAFGEFVDGDARRVGAVGGWAVAAPGAARETWRIALPRTNPGQRR